MVLKLGANASDLQLNINGLCKAKAPSVGAQILGEFGSAAVSIGSLFLLGAVNKASQRAEVAETQVSQEVSMQTAIQVTKAEIEAQKALLSNFDAQIQEVANKVSDKESNTTKTALEKVNTDLEQYKDSQAKITTAQANVDSKKTDYENAKKNYNTALADLTSLNENISALQKIVDAGQGTEDDEKNLSDLKREQDSKQADVDKLKAGMEQAQRDLNTAENDFNNLKTEIENFADIQKLMDEQSRLQARLNDITTINYNETLTELNKQKAKLSAEISQSETKLQQQQSNYNKYRAGQITPKKSDMFIEDGNQWTRNMPEFLGGASNDDKATFKLNHSGNDAIKAYMKENPKANQVKVKTVVESFIKTKNKAPTNDEIKKLLSPSTQ